MSTDSRRQAATPRIKPTPVRRDSPMTRQPVASQHTQPSLSRGNSPRPPSRDAEKRDRLNAAAVFCADSLSSGWREAVADRISDYAQNTWKRLFRFRRRRNCKELAEMAREILNAKDQIHKLAGELAGDAASTVAIRGPALPFTKEVAANIPINPIDLKMTAVARGIQISGVLLCVTSGRDLTKCQCFVDMALMESKETVRRILVQGMSDWASLGRYA